MWLRRSQHLSFFSRRDAVYCHHDLTGELTGMSADLRDLIVAFGDGAEAADVLRATTVVDAPRGHEFVETLSRLGILVGRNADERERVASMVPVIGRWACFVDERAGVTVVRGRNLSTTPELVRLDSWQSRLWRAIDGERNVQEVAAHLDGQPRDGRPRPGTLRRVIDTFSHWTHADQQWLKLSPTPLSYHRRGLPRPPWLESTMPYPRLADDAQPVDPFATGDGGVDNRGYHREAIEDASQQFEDRETTLAHLFRWPHPALAGRRFGEALVDRWRDAGRWPRGATRIVETGAGTGELAAAALARLPVATHPNVRWTILEISPALAAAQRARLTEQGDRVEVRVCDVEEVDLGEGTIDVLVSNEMAGDLRSDWLDRDDLTKASATARALLERHGIDLGDAPKSFWLNSGAIALVERAARALAPGGMLWLSEFGHRDAWPVESTQLDHAEVSLHFGVLAKVARQLGLSCEIVDVVDLIGLDESVDALSTTSTFFRNLRALAAARGVTIDKRAWTRDALTDALGDALPLHRVGNLRFQPIGERVMGLRPREFLALLATRPAGSPQP